MTIKPMSRLERKKPRWHRQVQDREMTVDGFTDFSFKAFANAYEKSAAPLSKRRNGSGPIHHQLGDIMADVKKGVKWNVGVPLATQAVGWLGLVWLYSRYKKN